MNADFVYLANFIKASLKLKMYLNFIIILKKKFLILARSSHLAPRSSKKIEIVSYNYKKAKNLLYLREN